MVGFLAMVGIVVIALAIMAAISFAIEKTIEMLWIKTITHRRFWMKMDQAKLIKLSKSIDKAIVDRGLWGRK